jgi:hypothetical protein
MDPVTAAFCVFGGMALAVIMGAWLAGKVAGS